MRKILSIAAIAGAALLVAACGGSAANNTANAPVDNGTTIGNDPMAPTDMNAGMPADSNMTSNTTTTTTTTAPGGNTTTTSNTTNAM